MTLKLNFVAASDRGLVRGNNEDSAYAGPYLLVLADGMGGHAAGEVASQLMVEHMEHLDRDPGEADMLALLGAAADDANAAIEASVAEHPEQEGMGTTLTSLMFNGAQLGLIHVGDSRGYRLRDGELAQITEDDTYVQSLVNEGKLDASEVSSHPQKSLILKAYTGRPVEPHLELLEARPGDRYLLCSDGLSDPVTPETIAGALKEGTIEIAAQRLIELALRSGGPDNITVVIGEVVDKRAPSSPEAPQAPIVAGALAPGVEATHPSSAASRAAALMRPAEAPREGDPAASEDPADAADEEDHPRRTIWPWVIGALSLALIALLGVGYLQARNNDTFFLRANEQGHILIEQGSESTLFGARSHRPIQLACINNRNELQIAPLDDTPADCHIFELADLPESQRGAIAEPAPGSYDDVVAQLNRLAGEALPACVEGKPEAEKTEQHADCRTVK
ncbi:PP2C family protein-serine/threonine phosphatase [Corynebacterium liangguodongii]|uniref:Protein phosphatase n=1 Tax=Corynebacterium liangguodongii TaxID=2079535 RepID=A0A2S0WBG5_9CORY|nr:protein phosphatase 2C domain-containing protein [Corynebacterium liangguodongii]AWB83108.1 protein phosphatase [Corynebacterium liangguodongii]PWB99291.1 serine/threonine-protein phosphatase [Corynebacterium liangguodongii]